MSDYSLLGLVTKGLLSANKARQEVWDDVDYKTPWDALTEKNRLHDEGEVPFASVVAKGVGSLGTAAGNTASGLFDLFTPDIVTDAIGEQAAKGMKYAGETLRPVGEYMANSSAGQSAQEFAKNNPNFVEAIADLGTGAVNLSGVGTAAKVAKGVIRPDSDNLFNKAAINTNQELDGFYGGGMGGKVYATAKAVPSAAYRVFKETFSPTQIQALKETGVPLGLYVQAVDAMESIDLGRKAGDFSKLNTAIKNKTEKLSSLKTEAASERALSQISELKGKRDVLAKELVDKAGASSLSPEGLKSLQKRATKQASYLSGAEAYQGILDIQFGQSRPLIDLVFGSQVMDVASVSSGGLNNIWKHTAKSGAAADVPPHVAQKFNEHLKKAWRIKDKNWDSTQILVKNPIDHHSNMGYEIASSNKNPVASFFKKAGSVLTPEELADVDTMKGVFNLYGSGVQELRDYMKLKRLTDSGASLTKPQQKNWNILKEKAAKKNKSVEFDKENGTFYVNGSQLSQAKELGGVNVFGSYTPNNRNYTFMQSDEHDMFGLKPIGGKNEVTVFPPLAGRIEDLSDKSAMKGYNRNAPEYREGPDMGAEAIEAATGIPLPIRQAGDVQTPYQQQRMQAILQSRDVNPDISSRLTAAERQLGLFSTPAVLNPYNPEEEE